MVTTSLMKILIFFEIFEILKFWKNFRVFLNRRWSPSVPNKYKTFIQSGRGTKNPRKRFTLPVHSLNNYGPLNIQTSNFIVENVVVMFIYWGTMRVITKLPNSEQSYKGKVKTHNYINRQNQSTTGKLWKP